MSLTSAGGMKLDDFWIPLQPKHSMIPWKIAQYISLNIMLIDNCFNLQIYNVLYIYNMYVYNNV